MNRALPLCLLMGCTGSSGGGGADYEFRLQPVLAKNQAGLFDELESADLVIQAEGADAVRVALDVFGTGETATAEGLPPLDGATVAIEGFGADGELLAFGRTRPLTVATADDAVDLDLFFARVDDFAVLSDLPDERFLGALSSNGQGGFALIGGLEGTREEEDVAYDISELWLQQPTSGLIFGGTDVALGPLNQGDVDDGEEAVYGRTGHSATLLTRGTHSDVGKVLIAGGTANYFVLQGSSYSPSPGQEVSWSAYVLDASTDPPTLVTQSESDSLRAPRSNHLAVESANGNIVMIGGFGRLESSGGWTVQSSVEEYDPSLGTFSSTTGDEVPRVFHAAARLGSEGVMTCGGFDPSENGATDTTCFIVDTAGGVTEVDGPGPRLIHPSMAALPDDGILLLGGLDIPTDEADFWDTSYDATNKAWIYRNGAWNATDSMTTARAMAGVVELPDGRVLVVGGATGVNVIPSGWGLFWDSSGAVGCAEIFSVADGYNFEPIGDCKDGEGVLATQVISPMVATDDTYGALVAGGIDIDDRVSGQAVLFVSPAR
jgi:hypothetical protein